MSPADARALIAHPSLADGGPQVWADLGSGDGTFTVALASILPAVAICCVGQLNADARLRSKQHLLN